MPQPIIPDLLDLFPDTVTLEEPTGFDKRGVPSAYGPARTVPARILGQIRRVTGMDGVEKVSSMQILLGGAFGVSPKVKITLPSRYVPRTPTVISVRPSTDENGPHHERVYCV